MTIDEIITLKLSEIFKTKVIFLCKEDDEDEYSILNFEICKSMSEKNSLISIYFDHNFIVAKIGVKRHDTKDTKSISKQKKVKEISKLAKEFLEIELKDEEIYFSGDSNKFIRIVADEFNSQALNLKNDLDKICKKAKFLYDIQKI